MRQEIRFARTADGVRIAYATAGHGPPLVKAANYLTHLEHDWESPVWRPWLRERARRHTLVRYDERGCGLAAGGGSASSPRCGASSAWASRRRRAPRRARSSRS